MPAHTLHARTHAQKPACGSSIEGGTSVTTQCWAASQITDRLQATTHTTMRGGQYYCTILGKLPDNRPAVHEVPPHQR